MPIVHVQDDDQVPLNDNLQEQDHHQVQEQESPIIDDEPQLMQYEQEDLPPHINDPYVEDVDVGHEVEPRKTLTSIMPQVAGRVDVDKILTGISEGRVTRKHLTNFCAHFSFVLLSPSRYKMH